MSEKNTRILPSPTKIIEDFDYIQKISKKYFNKYRYDKVMKLYTDYEEQIDAPASGKSTYHCAFKGGYIVHVANVIRNALLIYETYTNPDNNLFTEETIGINIDEIVFAAQFHDLYKLGTPGIPHYIWNDNQWKRNNMHLEFEINNETPYMANTDKTFKILNDYNIRYTSLEYYGIKLADGVYDESNKSYFIRYDGSQRYYTLMYHIIHTADMISMIYEQKTYV